VTINQGDEVVWKSVNLTHNAACTDPAFTFDTGDVGPGASSAPVKFTVASTDPAGFLIVCSRHHPTMKGHVKVNHGAALAGGGSSGSGAKPEKGASY
jgi:plastocyanin